MAVADDSVITTRFYYSSGLSQHLNLKSFFICIIHLLFVLSAVPPPVLPRKLLTARGYPEGKKVRVVSYNVLAEIYCTRTVRIVQYVHACNLFLTSKRSLSRGRGFESQKHVLCDSSWPSWSQVQAHTKPTTTLFRFPNCCFRNEFVFFFFKFNCDLGLKDSSEQRIPLHQWPSHQIISSYTNLLVKMQTSF